MPDDIRGTQRKTQGDGCTSIGISYGSFYRIESISISSHTHNLWTAWSCSDDLRPANAAPMRLLRIYQNHETVHTQSGVHTIESCSRFMTPYDVALPDFALEQTRTSACDSTGKYNASKALPLILSLQLAQINCLPAVASHPCFGDLLISICSQPPRLRARQKGQQVTQQSDQHISFCDVA